MLKVVHGIIWDKSKTCASVTESDGEWKKKNNDKGVFGSLDIILQHDVRFFKSLIHGITPWEYKIMVFGSLSHFNEIPLIYHSYVWLVHNIHQINKKKL